MIIPRYDPAHPDAPVPNQDFINTICAYVDPLRLVTTEVYLCGPVYKPIWISIGINVESGRGIAEVREAVKSRLLQFLSPLVGGPEAAPDQAGDVDRGWPLRKPVVAPELMARASSVPGVSSVNRLLLAQGTLAPSDQIEMLGLELPQVAGISVSVGEPASLDELRGQAGAAPAGSPTLVPVPVIPDECR
jgi:hypothetical protein